MTNKKIYKGEIFKGFMENPSDERSAQAQLPDQLPSHLYAYAFRNESGDLKLCTVEDSKSKLIIAYKIPVYLKRENIEEIIKIGMIRSCGEIVDIASLVRQGMFSRDNLKILDAETQ